MSNWLKNYKREAALIGEILTHYTNLEFNWANCLGVAFSDYDKAFRCLYRIRGGSARIEVGDALMRPHYESVGLKNEYETAADAYRYATKIRNQFAHAIFYDTRTNGLRFTNVEKTAKTAAGEMTPLHPIDEKLLTLQVSFFDYTSDCLAHLEYEGLKRAGKESYVHERPAIVEKPPLHSTIRETSARGD